MKIKRIPIEVFLENLEEDKSERSMSKSEYNISGKEMLKILNETRNGSCYSLKSSEILLT